MNAPDRSIDIAHLLERPPMPTDGDAVRALVDGATILVTGAGGTIGGELSRRIAGLGCRRLLLLDHDETAVFDIDNEIRRRAPSVEVVPIVADIRDLDRLRRVAGRCPPALVFHAAAHKHVPLMEVNVAEAIVNNVLGTIHVARVATELDCGKMVLVSTDKAVRPTSVMGVTKRIAEMTTWLHGRAAARPFVSVRFGNVLGSRGSVIPEFLRQIADGGPVGITHPEMRRYFMTIGESADFILLAAARGTEGDLFVFDMGEPLRIVDLADRLIRLAGLTPGEDIAIHFTGVRPGEKLYEEPFFSAADTIPTDLPRVLRAREQGPSVDAAGAIDELVAAALKGSSDDELRRRMRRLVPEYVPEHSPNNIAGPRSPASVPLAEGRLGE